MRKQRSYVIWLMIAFIILSLSCGKDKKSPTGPSDTYTLTGRILENGSGLSGAAVNIKGGDVDETVTTDPNGSYSLSGLLNGTYTITPSMYDYTFNPSSTDIAISGADATVSDIAATHHEIPGITFVTIPGGTFRMGDIQGGGTSDERPVHDVTLDGFDMSIYVITSAQYAEYLNEALASRHISASSSSVTGETGEYNGEKYLDLSSSIYCEIQYNDGSFTVKFGRENNPVIKVTWYGAKAFALNYGLDLPTEAEWEYACRAGTETKYNTGNYESDLSRAGWYSGNNEGWTSAVGQKEPNAWGLYDMHGNVWEWCHDWYDSGYYSRSPSSNPTGAHSGFLRVLRGGNYHYDADPCRSAERGTIWADGTTGAIGFRVVRRPGG